MNLGSPMATAILRGAYTAVVVGLLAFLTAWQTTDQLKGPVTVGLISALSSLGVRGIGEGLYDQHRSAVGNVKPGDVRP